MAQRLTGQRYIEYMRHGLGKIPASNHQLIDTLNQAGRELWTAGQVKPYNHIWSWAVGENVILPIKAGTELVELPADFGNVLSVQEEDRVVGGVMMTTVGHLLQLRADTTVSPLTIWLAFDVGPKDRGRFANTARDDQGKYVAIYPVQEADRDNIRMTYARTWIDYDAGDATDSGGSPAELGRVPNIPAEWEGALKLLAMSIAHELEDGVQTQYRGMYERELVRLINYDSMRQPNKGQVATSVRDRARGTRGYQYPHRSIKRV